MAWRLAQARILAKICILLRACMPSLACVSLLACASVHVFVGQQWRTGCVSCSSLCRLWMVCRGPEWTSCTRRQASWRSWALRSSTASSARLWPRYWWGRVGGPSLLPSLAPLALERRSPWWSVLCRSAPMLMHRCTTPYPLYPRWDLVHHKRSSTEL